MIKCFQLLALQTGRLLFLFFLLLFAVNKTAAQDSLQTASGFPLGVFSHIKNDDPSSTSIQLMEDAGINYIVDEINEVTGNTSFNLMGIKKSDDYEYIFYYSKGYYTRWEAERDEYAFYVTGFKHPHPPKPWGYGPYLYGEREYYNGAWSWATDSTSEFKIDSVLWGPNYKQDKNYTANFSTGKIYYTAAYRMALRYSEGYQSTDTVAALSIVYRYKWEYPPDSTTGYKTDTLSQRYLTVDDFPSDSFYTFVIGYHYPKRFKNKYLGKFPNGMYSGTDTTFIDDISLTGIEFQLDWYGVGKLYIDYVDLYDNVVGWKFQDATQIDSVKTNLITYANSFSNVDILKYWYVNDEPNTMDSYEPMRIVDSIVTNYATFNKPIITEIYPHWRGTMNGDLHLKKFVELTKPKQLMIDRYPFWAGGYTAEDGLFELRKSFQDADEVFPGFWYVAQGFSKK